MVEVDHRNDKVLMLLLLVLVYSDFDYRMNPHRNILTPPTIPHCITTTTCYGEEKLARTPFSKKKSFVQVLQQNKENISDYQPGIKNSINLI